MPYVAGRRLQVADKDGKLIWREIGELVPEADSWSNLRAYVQSGQVTKVTDDEAEELTGSKAKKSEGSGKDGGGNASAPHDPGDDAKDTEPEAVTADTTPEAEAQAEKQAPKAQPKPAAGSKSKK